MAEKKNYIGGSAREKTFDSGNSIINLSICLDDLMQLPKTQDKAGKAYVRITIAPRREVGKYGETHSIYEDTYTPKQNASQNSDADQSINPDDLPF